MVIEKKTMTEDEFWSSFLEPGTFSINQLALDEALGIKRFDSTDFQATGVTNRPFTFTRVENKQTQQPKYTIEQGDCQRLLKEIPALSEAYEKIVPLRKTEKEFWEEFMRKNLEFKTELFSGVNPVFIPYTTDEKDYEDKFIHNQLQLLDHPSKEDVFGKDRQPLLDVDYVRNLALNDMPAGYGSY